MTGQREKSCALQRRCRCPENARLYFNWKVKLKTPPATKEKKVSIAAGGHALLVVLGWLIVGVDDGVGSHTVGVVGLGPGVDGVDIVEHDHGKEGEHLSCSRR